MTSNAFPSVGIEGGMSVASWGIFAPLAIGSSKLGLKLYTHFTSFESSEPARETRLRRAHYFCPEVGMNQIEIMRENIRRACRASSMYLGVAALRILTGSICTSARFHTSPRGCLFGCSESGCGDADSLR
eukprot:3499899-Pyramimonas_sp.AAC.1